ncbi:endoplasmic reticulum resident protein 29 isoform X2 [Eurytemora carolleeae]|uniref:endoplasmic reticulum resident protein 29 isoform X2 n=1 Tax=Eurytemora carolleeae TaxID=1294199 RepID=UPI000C767041|nr:endoplasmic reticulum resident protein 29 isoform X2 [Eurytemora carolleeae]|eukprot:XP_023330496.1 endoplasmic reticulum resident protein 29-like isoform X2 [Eurytemora affinis]
MNLLLVSAISLQIHFAFSSQLAGVVMLDTITFTKMLFKLVIEDAILMAQVQVRDYGEKTNMDLANNYGVQMDKVTAPITILYSSSGGEIKEIRRLNGDFTEDDLRDFISSETGLYLQRPGCTRELDELSRHYLAADAQRRSQILDLVQSIRDSQVYLKLMQGIEKHGEEYLQDQLIKTQNMIQQKMSETSKKKLMEKINVINSFKIK